MNKILLTFTIKLCSLTLPLLFKALTTRNISDWLFKLYQHCSFLTPKKSGPPQRHSVASLVSFEIHQTPQGSLKYREMYVPSGRSITWGNLKPAKEK